MLEHTVAATCIGKMTALGADLWEVGNGVTPV